METTMQETKIQKMLDVWFDSIIDRLRKDQTKVKLGLATPEEEEFYSQFVTKPLDELHNDQRHFINMTLLEKAINGYSAKLNEYHSHPVKLALHFSDLKVLVFAIIQDDDEYTEDSLFLTEAFINAEFEKYGIHISTTILEESDNYRIPDHYKTYIG